MGGLFVKSASHRLVARFGRHSRYCQAFDTPIHRSSTDHGGCQFDEQVLQNLVSNAIKFNRTGGWIRLTLEEQCGMALVSVSNSGMEIPPSEYDRVFERFYRGMQIAEPGNRRHGTGPQSRPGNRPGPQGGTDPRNLHPSRHNFCHANRAAAQHLTPGNREEPRTQTLPGSFLIWLERTASGSRACERIRATMLDAP
jgi:hypothetical protein